MGILEGRVAIITGASSGIGRACAQRFTEEGATVVACARRIAKLQELADSVTKQGGKILPIQCDVTKPEDIDNVVTAAVKEFGKIDILANIAQSNMDEYQYIQDISLENCLGAYMSGPIASLRFMQKCFPYMKEKHYGRIINCASQTALMGRSRFGAYSMAKGAVQALSRTAAKEWARFGIVTNVFMPMLYTEHMDSTHDGKGNTDIISAGIPTQFIGKPYEDGTPLIAFMASEGAGYMNGQMIAIDGGYYLIN